jgi:transcription-repair coupling factor (superfamily II helicase)
MPLDLPQLTVVSEALKAFKRKGPQRVEVIGPWGSGKTLVAVQAAQALETSALIVTAGRIEAEAVYEDLCTFVGEDACALFPAWEVLPSDGMAPADDIVAQRMNTLMRFEAAAEAGQPMYTVLSARALMQHVPSRKQLVDDTLSLVMGEEYDLEELIASLITMGYDRELMVEQRGQMSVRGGIFDLFPIASELPFRLEFFGDELESIRRFEPETQRSVERVEQIQVLPRSEKRLLTEGARTPKGLGGLADYLPKSSLIVLDEPMAIREEGEKLEELGAQSDYFMTWTAAEAQLESFTQAALAQVAYRAEEDTPRITQPMRSMTGWERDVEAFWEQLADWDGDTYSIHILANNTGERQRLYELMEDRGYRFDREGCNVQIHVGRLRAGFVSPLDGVAVLSEREMFGRHYVRRVRRRFEAGAAITSFDDLKSGDYVVHSHHGIGRYLGLRRFEGKSGDFLAIQYSGGDKIYVPVSHIDQVQKHTGAGGAVPKIDKLGGATWARTKARVKKSVRDMTEELLKLYAARERQNGHAYNADTHWQNEFEDAFEYEETPDQARAIVEVKRDMESARPMDRLICGDVGFGKTEVALRAAFKAVMDGKQVAMLVPTTVLAEQHYLNFVERLADYPIEVAMLSRFRTPAQMKKTIARMRAGDVDIVVGTHRLISKDVQFNDLGLLVLDEEQRFGVAQKERLKQIRTSVDVLTMSATPIPRTLNMSLLGVRDMSVINTAPNDRLPIHTCIDHFDENLVKEAIQREVARQGQVFFLHNRVQTILPVAQLVRKLAPGARVAVGHGQMREGELEQVMTQFVKGEIDILVCTTIIGSGIDIPNANTIIINNAGHFGLSELYQLRGRVGRYKHRAFAYLLIPGDRALTEESQQRLKALEEFSTLGSGFRIAMRDMEIRGCGNILGAEQHGHIAAVGYDTYTQLVAEAVAEIKGEPIARRTLPPFDVAIDAYIPEEYVPSAAQKITLYKRISGVHSVEEVTELRDEIADRFGLVPAPVRRLLDVMRVRARGAEVGATRLIASKGAVCVEFESGHLLGRKSRQILQQEFGDRLVFAWQDTPSMTFRLTPGDPYSVKAAEHLLQALSEV